MDTLTTIFSEFGNVVDVVAKKNLKAKGQAFVVFDNPESALAAIEEAQGFEIFDKPMRLALARSRSDKTVLSNCTEEEFETHKRHRQAEKGTRPSLSFIFVVLTLVRRRQTESPRSCRSTEAAHQTKCRPSP